MYLQSSHGGKFILYGPTLSVYTKVMTRGVHNIMFSVMPDVFYPICLRINPVTMIRIAPTALHNLVTSRQGRSIDVSLVIDLQGQNKKARVLSASYEE